MENSSDMKAGGRIPIRVDLIVAGLVVVLSGYIFVAARRFPEIAWRQGGAPAFYPRILGVLLLIFAFAMLWESRTKPYYAYLPSSRRLRLMGLALVLALAMPTVLLPLLGFRISAFLFMLTLIFVGRGGRPDFRSGMTVLFSSVAITTLIYVAFVYVARVRLPFGSLTGW